jgi:hypothetical protein
VNEPFHQSRKRKKERKEKKEKFINMHGCATHDITIGDPNNR